MIKIRIATDGDIHQDAEKVIEYSIRKNTKQDVDLDFIRPGYKNGATGFTNHRFLIPELCNYEGYCIYMDVDMLVLGDLSELWEYRRPGKWVTTPKRDDVSVIDCSAFRDLPKLDEMKKFSAGRKFDMKYHKNTIRRLIGNRHTEEIPIEWNTCDTITEDAKLIHYTKLITQPWKPDPTKNYQPHESQDAVDLFFLYLELANRYGL